VASYLLDTSVIVDALNDKRDRRSLLLDLLRQGHLLACCSINVTEVYAGLRPKEEKATKEFLRSLEYYHVTWPVARLGVRLPIMAKLDHGHDLATLTHSRTVALPSTVCPMTGEGMVLRGYG
jgi:predicted nucleic acid-binding protein